MCGASSSLRRASAVPAAIQPALRPMASMTFTVSLVYMASVSLPASITMAARYLMTLPYPGQ